MGKKEKPHQPIGNYLFDKKFFETIAKSDHSVLSPQEDARRERRFVESNGCPEHCDCKWKKGKQAIICNEENMFDSLPSINDSGTQVLLGNIVSLKNALSREKNTSTFLFSNLSKNTFLFIGS